MSMHELESLYDAYLAEAERVERERKPADGLFGIGKKPSDDPCHDRFVAELEAFLKAFAASEPDSGTARQALAYIYEAPQKHREPDSAYWMLLAVHGMTLPLIGRLDAPDAAALREEYTKRYPRRERFPAQKQVLSALKKQET